MSDPTDPPAAEPVLDYPRMVHAALRDVARQALAATAEEGLPGSHHFVLSFKTRAPGVRLPAFLLDLHPEEMTVVLENQFWDLVVDGEAFSVTLAFGGARHRVAVPFAALTAFVDPSVPFGLRFDLPEGQGDGPAPVAESVPGADGEEDQESAPTAGKSPKVVRLDRFRDKR